MAALEEVLPSCEADDVSRLDQAARFIPDGDGDTAALIRHFARAHFVSVLCLGHATWKKGNTPRTDSLFFFFFFPSRTTRRARAKSKHARAHANYKETLCRVTHALIRSLTGMLTTAEVNVAQQKKKKKKEIKGKR